MKTAGFGRDGVLLEVNQSMDGAKRILCLSVTVSHLFKRNDRFCII